MKLEEGIKYLRANAKERKFTQSFDLSISLKNIDLKKPENKFSKEVLLPHGRGKEIKIGIISDNFKPATTKNDLLSMETDKKKAKIFTKSYDFFLCEAPLMPVVGKILGKYLAPRGRMPKLLPPNSDPAPIVENLKKSVIIKIRDSPTIHTIIGTEKMIDKEIEENVTKVLEEVKKALPKGKAQMRGVYLKMTMTKPVKIDVM